MWTVHRETLTQNITFKRGGRWESVISCSVVLYSNCDVLHRRLWADSDKIPEGGTSPYILHFSGSILGEKAGSCSVCVGWRGPKIWKRPQLETSCLPLPPTYRCWRHTLRLDLPLLEMYLLSSLTFSTTENPFHPILWTFIIYSTVLGWKWRSYSLCWRLVWRRCW